MNTSSISPISAAASNTANFVQSPDGSTVTTVRDQHQNIVSIAATPATTPASAVALASGQATGTADEGIHLTA